VNVIIPYGMDTLDWIDRTSNNLSGLVSVVKLDSGERWREWGSHVRQVLSVKGILTPDPDEFEDWTEWAARLNHILATL
jgi:hypothetical protein